MLGMGELKEGIQINEKTVECQVKGCCEKVERQRKLFRREERFKCPIHSIYISPSTFEYQDYLDNLVWREQPDLDLLDKIIAVKRESRIARDNREDAVTWSVLGFPEKNSLIEKFLNQVKGTKLNSEEVIYWSYSRKEGAGVNYTG